MKTLRLLPFVLLNLLFNFPPHRVQGGRFVQSVKLTWNACTPREECQALGLASEIHDHTVLIRQLGMRLPLDQGESARLMPW